MELTSSISFVPPVLPHKWREWNVTELLGRGAYGSVYRIVKEDSGQIIENAMKIISIPNDEEEEEMLRREYRTVEELNAYYKSMYEELGREIRTMVLLKDDSYIMPIIDYDIVDYEIGYKIFIQMPLLVSVTDYFVERVCTEKQVIKIGKDIAKALISCERNNIIHRDIKTDNIFFNEANFCLGDFGVAKQVDPGLKTLSIKGSYAYMAPEIFLNKKYDARVDIYSLGLVLYRMMNRNRDPFVDPDKQFIYYRDRQDAIDKRMAGEPLEAPADASPELASIILKACEYDPADRYQKPADFFKDLDLLSKGNVKKLSVAKHTKKKRKRGQKSKWLPWIFGGSMAVLSCIVLVLSLLLSSTKTMALPYTPSQKRILDKEEAKEAMKAVEDFDDMIWECARDQDYSKLLASNWNINLESCINYYRRGYHEEMSEKKFIVVAQVEDQDKKTDTFCVNAIRYERKPPFPEYAEVIPHILIEYTVQKDENGEWKISAENDSLRKKLISFMPEDYQKAFENRRFVQMLNGYACIGESLDKKKGIQEEALYEGNITSELSAIWQNEDKTLGLLVSFSNGTEQDYVVNYFTVYLMDDQDQVILEYKMEADQISDNVIKAGEYLTYSNIKIDANEVWVEDLADLEDLEKISCKIESDVDPKE